ncbi:MAG: hypothetical protein ACXV5Q_14310 [Frankiaceae bacterium]
MTRQARRRHGGGDARSTSGNEPATVAEHVAVSLDGYADRGSPASTNAAARRDRDYACGRSGLRVAHRLVGVVASREYTAMMSAGARPFPSWADMCRIDQSIWRKNAWKPAHRFDEVVARVDVAGVLKGERVPAASYPSRPLPGQAALSSYQAAAAQRGGLAPPSVPSASRRTSASGRTEPALNAFAITFDGRILTNK